MSELWQLGAVETAAKIRNGEGAGRAVMQTHLARADRAKPHLDAAVPIDSALT